MQPSPKRAGSRRGAGKNVEAMALNAPRLATVWVAACAMLACGSGHMSQGERQAAALTALASVPLDTLCQSYGPACRVVTVDRDVRTIPSWLPRVLADRPTEFRLPTELPQDLLNGARLVRVAVLPLEFGSTPDETRIWLLKVSRDPQQEENPSTFSIVIFTPGAFVPLVAVVTVQRDSIGWKAVSVSYAEG